MSSYIKKGLYAHINSGQRYFVLGLVREISKPHKIKVSYIKIKPHKKDLVWIEDINDFTSKFQKVE